ncbi:ABC transporter F family member 4 [Periplaneta americana]|uniref:ABC transporter F family member 4 n=1 Tax=Periplaneta americana TaxID=6978 RepID=UPI0037E8BB66
MLRHLGIGRRKPSDPFFSEGDAVCRADKREGVVEIDEEELCHDIVPRFSCQVLGCTLEFDSVMQFELHYNSAHRYYCSECKKRLPSPHLLDLHISETHDSFFLAQAQRQPMYRCYVEECDFVFSVPQERRSHCIEYHKFPHDFRFDDAKKQKPAKGRGKNSKAGSSMEVDAKSKKSKHKTKIAKTTSSVELMDSSDVQHISQGTIDKMVLEASREEQHKKTKVSPLCLGRGRGKRHVYRGNSNVFSASINKSIKSDSPIHDNVWGTSDLLDALQVIKNIESKTLSEDMKSEQNENKTFSEDMESEQDENKIVSEDMKSEQDENKTFSEDMESEQNENKTLSEDMKSEQDENETVSEDMKNEQDENKTFSEDMKSEQDENKTFLEDMKSEQYENKTFLEDIKSEQYENKTFSEDVKSEQYENKTFSEDVKSEQDENKTLSEDMKSEQDEQVSHMLDSN